VQNKLNHREHRGAARYTEKTKLSQRDYEALRLRGNILLVSSFFSHSLLFVQNILNHRGHRGAARYTEKTKLSQRDYEALRLRDKYSFGLLIFFSLCKTYLNHRVHRGAARYTEKPVIT